MNQISIALSKYNQEAGERASKGMPPMLIKNVHVGRNQWEMLSEEAGSFGVAFHEEMEELHEANRPEWEGYKVFRVDALDHISFS